MDRRLRINANIFYSEYTDIQLNFILAGTVADTKVANAGEAEMRGFETDITYLASENLMLMLNYAFLDAEVTKAVDEFGNDLTDSFGFYSAPSQSYTASADYTVGQYDWGQLAVNLSYNFMDNRRGGIRGANSKNVYLGEYGLINGRVSFSEIQVSKYGTLYFGLWGKNLTDKEYEITAVDNLPHSDRTVIWGDPRSYGIDLIYQY